MLFSSSFIIFRSQNCKTYSSTLDCSCLNCCYLSSHDNNTLVFFHFQLTSLTLSTNFITSTFSCLIPRNTNNNIYKHNMNENLYLLISFDSRVIATKTCKATLLLQIYHRCLKALEENITNRNISFLLTGTCFIGNQSDKALLSLVAIPMLTYWMIGSGYLLTGYLRKKSLPNLSHTLPAHINGMGTFLVIYCVPSGLLLVSMFYQFGNRESWLNLPDPSPEPVSATKAPLWLFITHSFLELLIGVLASAWAIGPRIAGLCKGNNVKQPVVYKAPPTTKFHQSPYHAASYQTICPPNSMVSSAISIGTINKMQRQHIRKYPPSHTHSHSHINRKPRPYRTSSQTMSLTGNETVL